MNTSVSEYEMPGEDPASFADIADFTPGEQYYELAAGDLQRMIRRTVFAAARDEGKYAMRGVLWDMEEKKAKLVATDGKRLAGRVGPERGPGARGEEGALAPGPAQGDEPARADPGRRRRRPAGAGEPADQRRACSGPSGRSSTAAWSRAGSRRTAT